MGRIWPSAGVQALLALLVLFVLCLVSSGTAPWAAPPAGKERVFVLMVWDGLRPDLVTEQYTPHLFEMEHEGARFSRHHSIYPTVTMVNAASIATGALPGTSGIYGDVMYLWPPLALASSALREKSLAPWIVKPADLENPSHLAALNGPQAFAGRLLGLDTIAQEMEREGGYVAVIGKQGATFLFDDRVTTSLGLSHKDFLFVSDDTIEPASAAAKIPRAPAAPNGLENFAKTRDAYFTRIVVNDALPAAKAALGRGRSSLIVLWQHNPDLTQHRFGLGTAPAFGALTDCDRNLKQVRDAIKALGIGGQADLMVVSDHGFATIRMRVALGELLVNAGLKKSAGSTDVVIARNGGSDLLYLSPADFPTDQARRDRLRRIVDFAQAQQWCGPIFARNRTALHHRVISEKDYLGRIDGTFSQSAVGLYNATRSPDLVISFRELSEIDNKGLTGPENPAFALGRRGRRSVLNRSAPLLYPVKGVVYADPASGGVYTTGMGIHGAAGRMEIHNFCAAAGRDFRRHMTDSLPTGNADIAPTIAQVLGLPQGSGSAGSSGRMMREALIAGGAAPGAPHAVTMTAKLKVQGMQTVTTLDFTRVGSYLYLDDSSVTHTPLGASR